MSDKELDLGPIKELANKLHQMWQVEYAAEYLADEYDQLIAEVERLRGVVANQADTIQKFMDWYKPVLVPSFNCPFCHHPTHADRKCFEDGCSCKSGK